MKVINLVQDHLQSLLKDLPPSYVNNSRSIISSRFRNILKIKDKKVATWIFQRDFGIDLDYSAIDEGEQPQ